MKTRYSAEPSGFRLQVVPSPVGLPTFGLLGIRTFSICNTLNNDELAYNQAFSLEHRSQRTAACNASRHELSLDVQRSESAGENHPLFSYLFFDLQSSLGGIPPRTLRPSCWTMCSFPALPGHPSSDDIVHDNVDGIRVVFISVEEVKGNPRGMGSRNFICRAEHSMSRKGMSNAWRE